jgi:predicted metal-dependent hydrolase
MKTNQYVIARRKEEKPFLARIEKVRDSGVLVALQKDIQYQKNVIEIEKKDIKVLLGENPLPGTVHGFDLNNLYRKTIEHDFWGPIHFFIHPEKETLKLLKNSLDRTAARIDKMGLSYYANVFQTEIRAKKGKYAGVYKHSNAEGKPNIVWYAPDTCKGDQKVMDYIVFHEFGHVIRFNGIKTNKMRNRWLRLYQKTIAQVKVESKTLSSILHDLDDYDEEQESFKGALNGATQDQSPRIQKAIMQWLKETHKITGRELEIMWRSSKLKDIGKYWPDHMIDTHDLKPALSDYATKNVEETFAECFAFYCQKMKLPNAFEELLEESISRAKVEGRDLGNKDEEE